MIDLKEILYSYCINFWPIKIPFDYVIVHHFWVTTFWTISFLLFSFITFFWFCFPFSIRYSDWRLTKFEFMLKNSYWGKGLLIKRLRIQGDSNLKPLIKNKKVLNIPSQSLLVTATTLFGLVIVIFKKLFLRK